MNYRHLFHAGSFADVMKHAALALVLERLRTKDKPFVVIDTHAGAGRYDLWAPEAGRSGEWRSGIQRLAAVADPPADALPYLAAVQALNPAGSLRWYPGSALLAAAALRAQDRLVAIEREPPEAEALRRALAGSSAGRIEVREGDGYAALKALLPPTPRRGLVVIDPPYEAADEAERPVQALKAAWRRWALGQYLIWYPIKEGGPGPALQRAALDLQPEEALVAELKLPGSSDRERLAGSGLLLLNPPWRLDEALSRLLPALAGLLARPDAPAKGAAIVRWLVPPAAKPRARLSGA